MQIVPDMCSSLYSLESCLVDSAAYAPVSHSNAEGWTTGVSGEHEEEECECQVHQDNISAIKSQRGCISSILDVSQQSHGLRLMSSTISGGILLGRDACLLSKMRRAGPRSTIQ